MTTAAIIAEYNPFHKGHAYHLEMTRKLTGADRIIVFMSGDFVQRGEPAIIDKYDRARAATVAGADAVFELPLSVSLASAGNFAFGGVKMIDALGFADYISFGCEDDDIESLNAAAREELEINSDDSLINELRSLMSQGLTYPEARDHIIASRGNSELAAILSKPNNNLAISYIEALIKSKSPIKPLAVSRTGGGHSDGYKSGDVYASASSIRNLLHSGCNNELINFLPTEEIAALVNYRGGFINNNDFTDILFYRIGELIKESGMDKKKFARILERYSDVTGDLALRIYKYCSICGSYDELAAKIWSKNLTYGRIDRVLQHIIHGIKSDTIDNDELYFHPIAIRKDSMDILTEIKNKSQVPLVMRHRDADKIKDKRAYINTRLSYSLYKRVYKLHHDLDVHDESGKYFTLIV